MGQIPLTIRRWQRAEYDRLIDLGMFEGEPLYARAGVADYWIVNLVDRLVELYREPVPDAAAVHGWSFRSVTRVAPPATVTPMAFPAIRLAVADLLPR